MMALRDKSDTLQKKRHPEYKAHKAEIDLNIAQWVKRNIPLPKQEYIRQMLTSAIKLAIDKASEPNLYMASVTLKELRHIFRVFAHYQDVKKVVMFGSHRSHHNSPEYVMALEFAREITKTGFMVITGGGGGVMEAGNCGAGQNGFAVKIKLPLEMEPNPFVVQGEKLINVRYFFIRKLAFIKESDAVVLFPGGFGTHDEGFEVLTLLQTGKCLPMPIVMLEPPGKTYWQSWLKFVEGELLQGGYLTPKDLQLFRIVSSVKEALQEITGFYRVYHSIKYGKDLTMIRLNQTIPARVLRKLTAKYRYLLLGGEIKPCDPLPMEICEKDCLRLPRICLQFNRRDYPSLMSLIRDLNDI